MAEAPFSLDLHVLGPPLTFALSQDQTLHRKFEPALRRLIAALPGGQLRPTWNGFFTNKKPISIKMACYPVFRDRCRTGSRSPRRSPTAGPSRDAAYTRQALGSSTTIEDFSADLSNRIATFDLADDFDRHRGRRSPGFPHLPPYAGAGYHARTHRQLPHR